jgi:xanthine/CO dehydrogenase XdhC/CoxF family maturation factor
MEVGGCSHADVNYLTERQNTKHKRMPTIPQRDLYRMINEAAERGERVVVATVAHTRGSTPQQRGAKMLFFQNGEVAGTVGGGCIEAEVWAEAQTALRSGRSDLHHFSLTADEASEEGMVCGGTMDIFVEALDPGA